MKELMNNNEIMMTSLNVGISTERNFSFWYYQVEEGGGK